jgi:hypothetical protein
MGVDCAVLWPAGEEGEALLHWGYIAGRLGADPSLSRPFLLGIRGAAPLATETHEIVHQPNYDDTFVLLAKSAAPLVFRGASHAYQRFAKSGAPDVNRDGLPDVATIRCDRYVLTERKGERYPCFVLTLPNGDDRIPCVRDTNHDERLSPAEDAAAAVPGNDARRQIGPKGQYATAVLFHTGIDAPADAKHRFSIACQTASLVWLDRMALAARASGGKIDYVLKDATDVIELAEERLRDAPPRSANVG